MQDKEGGGFSGKKGQRMRADARLNRVIVFATSRSLKAKKVVGVRGGTVND